MKTTIKVCDTSSVAKNGNKRQAILAKLGEGWKTARIRNWVVNGEIVSTVFINSIDIGRLPKSAVNNALVRERELSAYVSKTSSGKYTIELSKRVTPSTTDYLAMKNLCSDIKMLMPAYDMRAYKEFLDSLQFRVTEAEAV